MANQHVHHGIGPSAPMAPVVTSGLRTYLLEVYNYMAAGLALTGAVAYYGAASGFYASIVGTPLFWIVLLAPLALVLLLGFRIQRISLGAAQISFWVYAGLVGLSLSGILLVYTGESIARVFFTRARSEQRACMATRHGAISHASGRSYSWASSVSSLPGS
jgi:FtsH-binding integral membrane protein